MKLSVSLPDRDVAFLDRYAAERNAPSRSAVLKEAVRLLRLSGVEEAYAAAWSEWEASEDAALWDTVIADGLDEE